ncbi:MAG: ABC transporter substrate-binding protein [Clostridiales bacterium]|nr:ABC transporter substrate-binding protein [Clostridiales bacterium]
MKKWIVLLTALLLCIMLLPLGAMAQQQAPVRIWGLIGPTGMSLAPIMAAKDAAYDIQLAAAPEELVGTVVSGNYDIAALPTNLAAVLYQKTEGQVQMLAINTLGVLYVLEKGDTVHSAADLAGKTITLSGQAAVPEYALSYILSANGITDAVLDYRSEHNEVSALAAAGKADLVMLPQPMALALQMKDPAFRTAIDVTQAFQQAAQLDGKPDAVLSMGCLVVRKEFARQHPDVLSRFLALYRESVSFVNDKPQEAAKDIVAAGILPSEALAEKAIPLSHIVDVTGEEMKAQLAPLFEILLAANPASVGGKLPDADFYYIAK